MVEAAGKRVENALGADIMARQQYHVGTQAGLRFDRVYEPFPGTPLFEEGIRHGLTRANMARADFYALLPNHYYKVDARRQVQTIEPEQFALLKGEMKERFHQYNKHYRRILNRVRARMTQYLQSPRLLYTDFQKHPSWR